MARGGDSAGVSSARSSCRFIEGIGEGELGIGVGDDLPFEEDIDTVPAERTAILE